MHIYFIPIEIYLRSRQQHKQTIMMPGFDASVVCSVQVGRNEVSISRMQPGTADGIGQSTDLMFPLTCELELDPWHDDQTATNKEALMPNKQIEDHMPPPKPYRGQAESFVNSTDGLRCSQKILPRPHSLSDLHKQEQPGKVFLNTRAMTQSLPNIHSSRSVHNRILGHVLLAKPSESGNAAKSQSRRARVEEFDMLLQDL